MIFFRKGSPYVLLAGTPWFMSKGSPLKSHLLLHHGLFSKGSPLTSHLFIHHVFLANDPPIYVPLFLTPCFFFWQRVPPMSHLFVHHVFADIRCFLQLLFKQQCFYIALLLCWFCIFLSLGSPTVFVYTCNIGINFMQKFYMYRSIEEVGEPGDEHSFCGYTHSYVNNQGEL